MEAAVRRRLLPPDRGMFRWDIPDAFNIAERCCDSWAGIAPERVAITDVAADGTVRETRFGDLRDRSDRLAGALRGLGVERGDRVALLLSQGPDAMVGHFAAMKLGAVALPLFTLFGADALAYRLGDSGAVVAITDGDNIGKLREVARDLGDLRHLVCTDAVEGALHLETLIAEAKPIAARVETGPDDPAMMIYTSGTTGAPKGVLHAHRFLLGHLPCFEVNHAGVPEADDVGWTPADWAWIGGLMDLAMPCLYYGMRVVSHRMRKFDADAAWRLVARQGATRLFLPPAALRAMRHAEVPEGVAARSISSGGEALGADLVAWGRETLGAPITELYGQTECNLVVVGDAGGETRAGAIGRAVPGHRVAVLDEDDAPVVDAVGRIAVGRPDPAMFLEYWKQPEKTREKFAGDWMVTGDLGRMDADGFVSFVARDDDVINTSGYRIGPSEIEACLLGHEAVAAAAVVGLPDPERGQAITAFVVATSADAAGPELARALVERVRAALGPYTVPRAVHFRDALPMTATGKVMRRALRDGAE